jgi:hypothetical protein
MAQTQIRTWTNPSRNTHFTVFYDDGQPGNAARAIVVVVEALDPAQPIVDQGGGPKDGIVSGAELSRFCEGTTQVVLTAQGLTPYAAIATTANSPACDGSTLAITRLTGFAPVSPATTGYAEVQGSGGVGPYKVTVGPQPQVTANASGLASVSSLAPGSYPVTLVDSAATPATRTGNVLVPAAVINGCTLPGALNYNPTATANDGSCQFVAVDGQPAGLVAAHLPIAVQLRAAPIGGQPALVYLFLETAPTAAGPWTAAGTKRAAADPATAAVSFNVSEEAKALLRISPPVEAGVDPALSVLLRLRYVVRDAATSTDRFADTLVPFRALNAALAPPASGVLATGGYWDTAATLAAGVTATVPALPYPGCPGRVLVWLNRAGGWEQGVFTGRHLHGDDQTDPIAYRDAAGADRYASKGVVRDTLQVYSDKLDFATYTAYRGVRRAIQVYERTGAGQYTPVLVSGGSYQEYQEQTDKLFEVNFTLSYPPVLIQTQ